MYRSILPDLFTKARRDCPNKPEWEVDVHALLLFTKQSELYPSRTPDWWQYESERLVWEKWFGSNGSFPGKEPPKIDVPRAGPVTYTFPNRAPTSPQTVPRINNANHSFEDSVRRICRLRPPGQQMPSIDSVLANPQFRTSGRGIDFAAMNETALLTPKDLEDLRRKLYGLSASSREGKWRK